MALHGDIQINGMKIGEWAAVRQQNPPEEVNTYAVHVVYKDIRDVTREAKGEITHEFGKGALVLASEVLAWAGTQIFPGDPHRPLYGVGGGRS